MARTPSNMLPLGTPLPDFELPDTVSGKTLSSGEFRGRIVVIAFICNHCPYVKHIRTELAAFGEYCKQRDVLLLAVNSNDAVAYPEDSPENMAREAREFGYSFPYSFDASQDVVRSFQAACTPDFYVFDKQGGLAYRGQFDASRPSNGVPVTGADLRAAVDALLRGERPSEDQKPSLGCNIKWKSEGARG